MILITNYSASSRKSWQLALCGTEKRYSPGRPEVERKLPHRHALNNMGKPKIVTYNSFIKLLLDTESPSCEIINSEPSAIV